MEKDIQGWRVRPADESDWCCCRDFAAVVATFEASPSVASWLVERCALTKAEWEGLGDHDGW